MFIRRCTTAALTSCSMRCTAALPTRSTEWSSQSMVSPLWWEYSSFSGAAGIMHGAVTAIFETAQDERSLLWRGLYHQQRHMVSIQFDILPLLVPYPAFIGSLDMYGLYFMGIFFTLYISTYTTGRRRMTLMAYSIFQAVSVIFVEARQLAGRIDVYDTSFYGSNILMGALAVSLLALLCERRKRRKTFSTAVLFSVLPVAAGGCLDILFFWGNHYNANLWTRTGFLIFVSVQWGILVWQFKRNADAAAETDSMERALIQSRVAIMLSQIQPHFLYNALAAIKALCAKDPETAREAITRFSKYLRGNMDSLSHEPLITFDRELAHMKTIST